MKTALDQQQYRGIPDGTGVYGCGEAVRIFSGGDRQ
jgi:hypothetical protein